MGSDVVLALIFGGSVILTGISTLTVAWWRARQRALRAEARLPSVETNAARLARVEQSVDAVVLEVERIGESQRYTARLLTEMNERLQRPQVSDRFSASGRVITPH